MVSVLIIFKFTLPAVLCSLDYGYDLNGENRCSTYFYAVDKTTWKK